jgi:hypothetical protein
MNGFGDRFPNDFTDEERELILAVRAGPYEDLREAYEGFARDVAESLMKHRGVDRLDDDFFATRPPIRTIVYIEPAPRNNWVKAYWVKAY